MPACIAILDRFRPPANTRRAAPELAPTPAQLPLWPEPTRGTPNTWLRGALFAAIQGKERRALKRELLATVDGISIRYTGWQLDQSDLDVWDVIVHMSRCRPLDTPIDFSAHAILRELGRDVGKSQHEWLKDAIARLYSGGVEITAGRYTYFGALLHGARDDDTGRYVVQLHPTLLGMYLAGWTQINWDERTQLRRKPLALWLHGWYATHAQPYALRVDTLQRLSGSRNRDTASFRRQLKLALAELEAIGAIASWDLDRDIVRVRRTPTPSQRRHLARPPKSKA